jgi:hypothetical protein
LISSERSLFANDSGEEDGTRGEEKVSSTIQWRSFELKAEENFPQLVDSGLLLATAPIVDVE